MLAPHIPLRMIAQYTPIVFPESGADLDLRRAAIETALANCRITSVIGTDQMNVIQEPELRDDVCKMRATALTAIPFAEKALKASRLEDFNEAERDFRTQYANLIRSVKNFLWDAGDLSKHYLWPLVEELM